VPKAVNDPLENATIVLGQIDEVSQVARADFEKQTQALAAIAAKAASKTGGKDGPSKGRDDGLGGARTRALARRQGREPAPAARSAGPRSSSGARCAGGSTSPAALRPPAQAEGPEHHAGDPDAAAGHLPALRPDPHPAGGEEGQPGLLPQQGEVVQLASAVLQGLMPLLGLRDLPQYAVIFLPTDMEDEMLRLEEAFQNRREDQIQLTEFEIQRQGDGFRPVVVRQVPRTR